MEWTAEVDGGQQDAKKKGKHDAEAQCQCQVSGKGHLGEEDSEHVSTDPYLDFIPPLKTHFFMYIGSITTPPCTTDVVWILHPTSVSIFSSSLDCYRQEISMYPKNQLAITNTPYNFTVGSLPTVHHALTWPARSCFTLCGLLFAFSLSRVWSIPLACATRQ